MTEHQRSAIKIILDTDIGDDIDDAIALTFALGSREFDLLGVTVVYGDVITRARIARKLLRLCGRGDVPVAAGYERPMGFDYHPGTVPEECSQRQAVADDAEPLDRSPSAPDLIGRIVRANPGQVHVLTIGAMTNVGAALCADPSLADQIASVVSLAGYVPPRESRPEWNVRYDPLAARCIAASGVPWTATGADVQGDNRLTRDEFAALGDSGSPAARFLLELIVLMKRHKGGGNPAVRSIDDVKSIHVADVMTLASFLVPEQMALTAGRIEVDDRGAIAFAADEAGPHRFALGRLAGHSYRAEILRRLLAAGQPRK